MLWSSQWSSRPARAFLCLSAGLALALAEAQAQPPAKPATKPDAKPAVITDTKPATKPDAQTETRPDTMIRPRAVVRAGYTRPGNPPDQIKADGTIRAVAHDPGWAGLGGTVYFTVLELVGLDGDPWGTGQKSFADKFIAGRDSQNNFSPNLDTRARYLYLYQVVNDRGIDKSTTIKPAAEDDEIATKEIALASLRLLVDPGYITSWGHFTDFGFAVDVVKKEGTAEVSWAALGTEEEGKFVRMAVSSVTEVTEGLPSKVYGVPDRPRLPAPAYPLQNLLGLDRATVGLKDADLSKQLVKKDQAKIKLAAYEQSLLRATVSASRPDFVELLATGFDTTLTAARASLDTSLPGFRPGMEMMVPGCAIMVNRYAPVFRAGWRGKNVLKLGEHSTLFGFTTNLPPTDSELRIRDSKAAVNAEAVTAAGAAQPVGTEVAPGVAPTAVPGGAAAGEATALPAGLAAGTAATPMGGEAPAAYGVSTTPGLLSSTIATAGGIGGGVFFPPLAGFGRAAVSAIPSVGSGGGAGSGNGNAIQRQRQAQGNNSTNSQQIVQQIVNVNQQQSQQQTQTQTQTQSQSQRQRNNQNVKPIPEPMTLVLLATAVPFFLLLWYRTRMPRTASA